MRAVIQDIAMIGLLVFIISSALFLGFVSVASFVEYFFGDVLERKRRADNQPWKIEEREE